MRLLLIGVFLALIAVGCAPLRPPTLPAPPPSPEELGFWTPARMEELQTLAYAAPMEGLPEETAALQLLAELRAASAPMRAAAADALLARLWESYARGAVSPALDPEWHIAPPPAPGLTALRVRMQAGESALSIARSLAPRDPQYDALRVTLARVRAEPAGARDAAGLTREDRLDRIRATLERWRWLPRVLPARRIDVRVPLFELSAAAPGEGAALHNVIVGARATPTPSFISSIASVTVNPTWTPPSSILFGEIAPRLRRDPGYAARQGFVIVNAAGAVVPASAVDWSARPLGVTLHQRAGEGNALGRLRFDMRNPYGVYLHDTSSRGLFARPDRALSHGCVRVQDPRSLAVRLLPQPQWTRESLDASIDRGATVQIPLGEAMPVYVLYLTAAARPDGTVAYGADIYGRDHALLQALAGEASPIAARGAAPQTECSVG